MEAAAGPGVLLGQAVPAPHQDGSCVSCPPGSPLAHAGCHRTCWDTQARAGSRGSGAGALASRGRWLRDVPASPAAAGAAPAPRPSGVPCPDKACGAWLSPNST